jgi:hypothetical protein
MIKQMGASFTVRGYLLILLVAAGALSAATNLWLSAHRTIDFSCRPEGSAAYPSHKGGVGIVRMGARIIS